jgi:regulator of PEP synthase PpsR (kinase-PPPase family)
MATRRRAAKTPKSPVLWIVSDGRGETAAQLLRAATLQFEGVRYRLKRHRHVRTAARVESIIARAAKEHAPVFYTLVADDTRRAMRRAAAEHLVAVVDLLGPSFRALHDVFHRGRIARPGLLEAVERERTDRMDAIDYTLKHDDGQRPHELHLADVVLVGVSRSAKSSTCFYLAYEGIRAANVPLVPGVDPPAQLTRLPQEKVVGLRINLDRLLSVRDARARNLRLRTEDDYTDKRTVGREIVAANRIMERHGWESIDASYLAIEEIAHEVLRLRGLPRWSAH